MQSLLNMVRLVQLVEHQIVVLGVVGSSPTSHPKNKNDLPRYGEAFFLFLGRERFLPPSVGLRPPKDTSTKKKVRILLVAMMYGVEYVQFPR